MAQHLNNTVHLSYAELAKKEAFEKIFKLDTSKYIGVVRESYIQYKKPIPYGMDISILMSIASPKQTSSQLFFEFVDANDLNNILAVIEMKQIFFDVKKQKPAKIPENLMLCYNTLINNKIEHFISIDDFLTCH
jgi:acyl-CoA thioesterase FadM